MNKIEAVAVFGWNCPFKGDIPPGAPVRETITHLSEERRVSALQLMDDQFRLSHAIMDAGSRAPDPNAVVDLIGRCTCQGSCNLQRAGLHAIPQPEWVNQDTLSKHLAERQGFQNLGGVAITFRRPAPRS
jgi:hypothetical protein